MRYCHIDNLTAQIGQTLKLNGQLTFSVKWQSFVEKYITLGSFLQKKKYFRQFFANKPIDKVVSYKFSYIYIYTHTYIYILMVLSL